MQDNGGGKRARPRFVRCRGRLRKPGQGTSELRARLEDLATLVHSNRDALSVAGLALATRGVWDLGRDADARALLQSLMGKAVKDGGLHWPEGLDESDWFGEAEENTGYALGALLAVDPKDARAASIVEWLARRRTGRMWRSTRTTGPVAIALAEYLWVHPGETRADLNVTVAWDGVPPWSSARSRRPTHSLRRSS